MDIHGIPAELEAPLDDKGLGCQAHRAVLAARKTWPCPEAHPYMDHSTDCEPSSEPHPALDAGRAEDHQRTTDTEPSEDLQDPFDIGLVGCMPTGRFASLAIGRVNLPEEGAETDTQTMLTKKIASDDDHHTDVEGLGGECAEEAYEAAYGEVVGDVANPGRLAANGTEAGVDAPNESCRGLLVVRSIAQLGTSLRILRYTSSQNSPH